MNIWQKIRNASLGAGLPTPFGAGLPTPPSARPQVSSPAAPPRSGLSVERKLQINTAVLVPLGVMMLEMRDGDILLASAVLIAALASMYVVDFKGWLRLNRIVANVIALLATAFSAVSIVAVASANPLTTIADLLIYLQLVLLFQQKTVRMYWLLMVLSGLEVVVATVVTSSLLFGLLLIVYLFVALTGLGLVFILQEAEHIGESAALAQRQSPRPAAGKSASPASRWPLAREIQVVAGPTTDLPRQILGSGIFWRTAGIGIGTLIVALVCFFFLPRLGPADANDREGMIGYNPAVNLEDMGKLLKNHELVMTVDFQNGADQPLMPAEPPLLRGSLLNHYHRGEWKLEGVGGARPTGLPKKPADTECVRQRIALEPLPNHDPILFGVYPPYGTADKGSRRVRFDHYRQQLVRDVTERPAQQFVYELLTTGLPGGRQTRLVSELDPSEDEMPDLLQLPDGPPADEKSPQPKPAADKLDQLSGLRELAAKWIREAKIPKENHYAIAKLLERSLSGPPFEYTLDRPPSAPGIDPIEDFVTRNPRGHCEYFATALTLMLRSRGIPARMVIGFHGGNWNPAESHYDVQQSHAHAWVEAFLTAERLEYIPPADLPPGLSHDDGAWLTLDPTPPVDSSDAFASGTFLSSIADLSDYIQTMWSTYVVGLNPERQDKAIYRPLADFGRALEKLAAHPKQAIGDMFSHLRHWLFGGGDGTDSGLDWYVLGALVVLAVAISIAYRLIRILVRASVRLLKRRRSRSAAVSRVGFYRRFEAILARHGIRRRPGQTQLELAQRAAKHLTATLGPSRAAALPSRLVATFYRVRFGGAALDATEAQAVEQLLAALREGLATGGRGQGAGDRGGGVASG